MLLLLGILKRNNKYFMNVVNTDKEINDDGYEFINPYILNKCDNVSVQRFLSNKQNPKEYLRGEFDVANLIVDDQKLVKRVNDYQIITIYHDNNNVPCMYASIDRAGNLSLHDISEFYYTKYSSILGDNITKLPSFVEHKNVVDAYRYFDNKEFDIMNMPVGLAQYYLMATRNFSLGSHTITKVNHGIPLDIHEYMLFNGTATIKLVEYVTKDKKVFLTKQDDIANPYPKERTTSFLSGPLVLLGSVRLMPRFCKMGTNTEFAFYNKNVVKLSMNFDKDIFEQYDRYYKSKDVHTAWKLDFNNNISKDIYRNILPNQLFKFPERFYRDMKNLPFNSGRSYRLEEENSDVETWIYTVALLMSLPYYTDEFKKRLVPILKNYQEMYKCALDNLLASIGPRDTFVVMKWMKEHLKIEMKDILGSDLSLVDQYDCLFTFKQNDFDLPEALKVYKEETILKYGGVDKLRSDFETPVNDLKTYIINTLEKLEKNPELKIEDLRVTLKRK